MKVAAHTLGCKLNFAETSHLLQQMEKSGHTIVDYHAEADIYIINTCTVTALAERKCRNAIRQALRQNPDAHVAVIGCFANTGRAQIEKIKGVSLILDNSEKHLLPGIIEKGRIAGFRPPTDGHTLPTFAPAWSSTDRTRAFLKIQDGCDYFCTYCAIPIARGRSRSATISEAVAMARLCAQNGAKEIVLTGVNTGTFGLHNGERFIDLLHELDKIEEIKRYRISSIEPNLITEEIIDFTARSRAFLPHFHIPLQAGCDAVLKLMHRHYDTSLYRQRIEFIKQRLPDACIAADIIAGINGETDEHFEQTKNFLTPLPISYLHVFTYSERPHTAALKLTPRTDVHTRRTRSQQLHSISNQKLAAFVESQIGKTRPVLWESDNHDGKMHGLTDNYIRLQRPFDPHLVNTITNETITRENAIANIDFCE